MAANPSSFAHLRLSPPAAGAPLPRVLSGGWQAEPAGETEGDPLERAPESRTFRVDASSPDDVLAMAAGGGNHRAAAIIVRRYTPKVRSRLQRWIGLVDIDDHVQNAFIRLFEQLPRLRDPSALRGFLVGITLRIACTELRRRRRSRTQLTATGDVPEPETTANDSEPAREALWRFESILGRLAPSSRRVFMLRYVEKLELTDIAAEMGISVATVKRHFARAATAVSAMVKREPALAEYLPIAVEADEAGVARTTAGSEATTSPQPAASAGLPPAQTSPSPDETRDVRDVRAHDPRTAEPVRASAGRGHPRLARFTERGARAAARRRARRTAVRGHVLLRRPAGRLSSCTSPPESYRPSRRPAAPPIRAHDPARVSGGARRDFRVVPRGGGGRARTRTWLR